MQTVSQAWKDAQRRTIVPPSQIEILIGMGDPDAQAKAVCDDNGHESFSNIQVITDASQKTPVKYATLEPDLWMLDGTYRLLGEEGLDTPVEYSAVIGLGAVGKARVGRGIG